MVTVCFASKHENNVFKQQMESYFGDSAIVVNKISNPGENGKYISEVYNEMLNEAETDVVIFVHDNIEFIDSDIYRLPVHEAIEYQFDNNPEYAVIGVGPRSQMEPDVIVRDHFYNETFYTKCEEDGSEREEVFSGRIEKFSLELAEADLIDGVFMAVKRSRLKAGFRNENKSFDFYDLDLCVGNILNGAKVGITKAFNLLHYRTREENGAWERYARNKPAFMQRWEGCLPIKCFDNKQNLLIITPCSRIDNLSEMAAAIERDFSDRRDYNFLWLICVDNYNAVGDYGKFARETFGKRRINICVVPSGLEGQKNYGGDMFNTPLMSVKEGFYGEWVDPWVLVMDDDNISCPLMADQFAAMTNCADSLGKKIIWMSMNREDGFIDTVRSYSIFGKGAFNDSTIADEFMPDPSEILIRYSKLAEMGFYDSGYGYDQKFWWYFYEHMNEVLLPEEWHPGHWCGRPNNNFFQCYHNGMNRTEVPYVADVIKEKKPISFSLVVGTDERSDRFVLGRQEGVDAFNKYANGSKYKYSILTCIFGGYESLKTIRDYRDDVEYVCVTDNHELKSDQWKIVYCDDFFSKLPSVDRFAYIRFHPFNFVSTDVCVTIDASMQIRRDFYDPIVKTFLEGGYEYAVSEHYDNRTIKEDIDTWEAIRGYKEGDYQHITSILGDEADTIQGAIQGGFIIHKDTKYAHKVNDMAWELCHALSTDNSADRNFQVELEYVLNTVCKDKEKTMIIHPYILEGTFIRHWTHSGQYWIVYHSKETCPCVFWNEKVEPFIFD